MDSGQLEREKDKDGPSTHRVPTAAPSSLPGSTEQTPCDCDRPGTARNEKEKRKCLYVSEENRHIHIHTGKTKHTHRCTHKCPPSTHTHMYMFTLRHSITEKLFGGYGVAFLTHGESAPHLKQ